MVNQEEEVRFVANETPSSSVCNLDCSYCYIPKNDSLKKIHKKWQEKIKDNKINVILAETFGSENLRAYSLWGAEPSIGFNKLDLDDLYTNFPNLNDIGTSTNSVNHKLLVNFLTELSDCVDRHNRPSALKIQMSLDGPESTTDDNRGEGVYTAVIKTIEELNKASWKISGKLSVHISFKSTNTIENYKRWIENPSEFEKFIRTFNDIGERFSSDTWPNNFKFHYHTLPSLPLPGDYTSEDGRIYYEYHLMLEKVIDKLRKEEGIKYIKDDVYSSRLLELFSNIDHINDGSGRHVFNCGAGRSMLAVDPDGTVHGCHGSFWYNYEDYLDTIESSNSEWKEGKRVMLYDKERFKERTKDIISPYRDELNESRLVYILSAESDNFDHRLNVAYATTKMLAISGQVSEVYKDDNWAKLFAYFIVLQNYCWLNNKYTTDSINAITLSIYRIYGNGLFEFLLNRMYHDKLGL